MITDEQFEELNIESFKHINPIDDVKLINTIKIDKNLLGRPDIIINRYYYGEMKYLPLLLDFNNLSDITEMKAGMFFDLPDIDLLLKNIVITDILESNNIPGIKQSTEPLMVSNETIISMVANQTTANPKLNITLPKVTYNPETGIIKY